MIIMWKEYNASAARHCEAPTVGEICPSSKNIPSWHHIALQIRGTLSQTIESVLVLLVLERAADSSAQTSSAAGSNQADLQSNEHSFQASGTRMQTDLGTGRGTT